MRRSPVALALALVVPACLASDDTTGGDGGTHSDAPASMVQVTVTAPTAGAEIARDDLAMDGSWVANVTFTAAVVPAAAQVDWMAGGVIRGTGLPPDYAYTAQFSGDGSASLSAVVHAAAGAELGRADVAVTILPSTAEGKDCHGKLDAIGVSYLVGPDTMGIPDPVTVRLPLGALAVIGRTSLVMDCAMALSFHRMALVLAAHGVVAIADGGSGLYSYRCVSGSESPPCASSGFSLHAYGQAYDLTQLETGGGAIASVGTDWVKDTGPTCDAVSASAPNQLLHDVLCDLYQNGVFTVVLTPNFQAAQDFVHLDLTAGQTTIQ